MSRRFEYDPAQYNLAADACDMVLVVGDAHSRIKTFPATYFSTRENCRVDTYGSFTTQVCWNARGSRTCGITVSNLNPEDPDQKDVSVHFSYQLAADGELVNPQKIIYAGSMPGIKTDLELAITDTNADELYSLIMNPGDTPSFFGIHGRMPGTSLFGDPAKVNQTDKPLCRESIEVLRGIATNYPHRLSVEHFRVHSIVGTAFEGILGLEVTVEYLDRNPLPYAGDIRSVELRVGSLTPSPVETDQCVIKPEDAAMMLKIIPLKNLAVAIRMNEPGRIQIATKGDVAGIMDVFGQYFKPPTA